MATQQVLVSPVRSETGEVLPDIKVTNVRQNTIAAQAIKQNCALAGVTVTKLAAKGYDIDLNATFGRICQQDLVDAKLEQGAVVFTGLSAVVHQPEKRKVTEIYTPPSAPAYQHGPGKEAEGQYGGKFVNTPVRNEPGRPVQMAWLPQDEAESHAKKSKLEQERGLLNDGQYFAGRNPDPHHDRKIPSRFISGQKPGALRSLPLS